MLDRPRPHWSYSAITQYLRCPLQYYFQRVLCVPGQTIGTGLVMGSAVHAGLAEYHRRLMVRENLDGSAIRKTFLDCWNEKAEKQQILYRDGETRDDCIAQGVQLLELYLQEPPPEKIVSIEQRMLVPLYNSQGEYLERPLLAFTDLVTEANQELTVTEFKTSARAYSASDVDSSLQPTCYVHAVRESQGREANVEYTVLVKTKTPKVQRLKTSRFPEDSGRLGDLVQAVERAVELEVFYPVENAMNCSGCSYRQQCREWGHRAQHSESCLATIDGAGAAFM